MKFRTYIHSLLLVTCTSLLTCPQYAHSSPKFQELPFAEFNLTYDDVLGLLRDIEEERINNLSEEELEKITRFITYLAEIGIDPNDITANDILKNDIAALFHDQEYFYEFAQHGNSAYASTTLSALLNGKGDAMARLCKRKKDKKKDKKEKHKEDRKKKEEIKQDNHKHEDHDKHEHKKGLFSRIAHFVKKHKKAIIIGAAIVVAAAAVVVAVGAVSAAAAAKGATAVAAATGPALAPSDKKDKKESSSSPPPDPADIPQAVNDQLPLFQEKIVKNQFFDTADPTFGQQGVPVEENGRILGSLLAQDSFMALQNQMPYYQDEGPYIGQSQIDSQFSTDYMHLFTNPTHEINFNALPYQVRGETALNYGYYDQAVSDFERAIRENPYDPVPFLQRGIAHFGLGDYTNSISDFESFTRSIQTANPLSIAEFNLGATKGVVRGIYESGEANLLFLADFVKHPIQTSRLLYEAGAALVNLARNGEWGLIRDALVPEVRELIDKWDTLSPEQIGELEGHILGKYGADILFTKGLGTLLSNRLKLGQDLIAIAKKMQLAKEVLILETTAGIGIPVKIAEIVEVGQRTFRTGEELGYTAQEMGQLKQVGELESATTKGYDALSPPMKESHNLFKKAQEALQSKAKKPMPEFEVRALIHKQGISTFPRPAGIPEDYLVMISDGGAGMMYVDPKNAHFRVRVMPGKPHSPNPIQQRPYVIQTTDKGALNKAGNYVSPRDPEAHIPIDEFIYRNLNGS